MATFIPYFLTLYAALVFGQVPPPQPGDCMDAALRAPVASAYLLSARMEPLCIRAGVDDFRLTFAVADPQITLVRMATQGRILYQDSAVSSIEFFDDGTHGDAMAGDRVFTLNELSLAQTPGTIGNSIFRFVNMTFRYADAHEESSNEDLGLTLHYLSPSVPIPPAVDLAPDVRATRYAVNIVMPLQGSFPSHSVDNRETAHRYYEVFPDDRDFLFMAKPFNTTGSAASFGTVRNDILGIGLPMLDNSAEYGSAGILQGTVNLYFGNVSLGTLNHELLHRWAAFLDSSLDLTGTGGHWRAIGAGSSGFGGSPAYAGSFDVIEHISGDMYRGSIESAGRCNPLELYLMGLIDIAEVPTPIAALINPVFQAYQDPYWFYTADGLRQVSTAEIVAVEGERIPGVADSQKLIRSALIVVYDRPLTDIELAYYDYAMREYEKSSGSSLGLTFAEATGGRATLDTALPCIEGMASLNCVSVPAVSGAGLTVFVVALLGAGVIVIMQERCVRNSSTYNHRP